MITHHQRRPLATALLAAALAGTIAASVATPISARAAETAPAAMTGYPVNESGVDTANPLPEDVLNAPVSATRTDPTPGTAGGSQGPLPTAEPSPGVETRERVDDSTALPYRNVVQMNGGCSGALIGPDTVLLAAHCVTTDVGDSLAGSRYISASSMAIAPALNDKGTAPYGRCGAEELWLPDNWESEGRANYNYDWAVLKLDCEIGDELGWFGLQQNAAGELPETMYTAGYPSDIDGGLSMMSTLIRPNPELESDLRFEGFATVRGGQSGSPVFTSERRILGVVGGAAGDKVGGARIGDAVFPNLVNLSGV